jgi:choline dehydrogenase
MVETLGIRSEFVRVDGVPVASGGGGKEQHLVAHLERLSADGTSVLVLEAGRTDDDRKISIPAAFVELFQTDVDWEYYTEPQPELDGRELYWPRGKVLGGSSAVNAMVYIRGHPADYGHWDALGNDGWAWEEILPYFTRAERNERFDNQFHGVTGPLNVCDLTSPNPLSETFVNAAISTGLPPNDDFNNGDQEGVGFYQVTQEDEKRHSAADAHLEPELDRPSLAVETEAFVTRIQFDGKRAVGVKYEHAGETIEATANEEVILCEGTIN